MKRVEKLKLKLKHLADMRTKHQDGVRLEVLNRYAGETDRFFRNSQDSLWMGEMYGYVGSLQAPYVAAAYNSFDSLVNSLKLAVDALDAEAKMGNKTCDLALKYIEELLDEQT